MSVRCFALVALFALAGCGQEQQVGWATADAEPGQPQRTPTDHALTLARGACRALKLAVYETRYGYATETAMTAANEAHVGDEAVATIAATDVRWTAEEGGTRDGTLFVDDVEAPVFLLCTRAAGTTLLHIASSARDAEGDVAIVVTD